MKTCLTLLFLVCSTFDALADTNTNTNTDGTLNGRIEVLIDRERPESGTLEVEYVYVPPKNNSSGGSRALVVIPSLGASIAMRELFEAQYTASLRNAGLLLMDMRGFGRSSPVTCPRSEIQLDYHKAIDLCTEHLGKTVNAFNIRDAALDLEQVRAELRIQKLDLVASSYGGVLAQYYALRFQDRVRSLVLDSTPTLWEDPLAFDHISFQERRRILKSSCPDCLAALHQVAARARTSQLDVSIDDLSAIWRWFPSGVSYREFGPALLAGLNGDVLPLKRLAHQYGQIQSVIEPHVSVVDAYVCNDFDLPFDRSDSINVRTKKIEAVVGELPWSAFAPFALEELFQLERVTLDGTRFRFNRESCERWPYQFDGPSRNVYPPHPLGVNALIVSGELDVTVPTHLGSKVAEKFQNSQSIEIPFGDHSATFFNECIRELAISFIKHPTETVESECVGETLHTVAGFPTQLSQLGEENDLATVHHAVRLTVEDVLARKHRNPLYSTNLTSQPGLRGGDVSYQSVNKSEGVEDQIMVVLDGVRYLEDLEVSGEAQLNVYTGEISAKVHATLEEAEFQLELEWIR
ncbi:MAG: alpha/beta fold hydrolase [Pseudomonadota bacterium]